MSKYKRIFVIGHPGAGKGLLAKTIAEKLGWQFVDADFGLEFTIGRTMTEIVGKQGEKAFNACEAEIIASLQNKENIVVATDASIICDENNRNLLSSEFVVYLKVNTEVQVERTSRNPKPLLLAGATKTFLDKLHVRDELYEQAAILTINGEDSDLEKHVAKIMSVVLAGTDDLQVVDPLALDENDLIIFHKNLHIPIHLSNQQAICLKLLAQGKSSKEIAREMNISYRTVEGYLAKTMEILGCTSSKELIGLYHEQP